MAETSNTDRQKLALERAKEAAANSEPRAMLQALHESELLDGLALRMRSKWNRLPPEDVDMVIALSTDAFYDYARKGGKVFDVGAFFWKVSQHKAYDISKNLKIQVSVDPQKLGAVVSRSTNERPDPGELRAKAIAESKRLISQLGHENVQKVMTYVICAVEAGMVDVPTKEIADALGLVPNTVTKCLSRGFDRLKRLAREEGFSIDDLEVNVLEDAEDDDSEEVV